MVILKQNEKPLQLSIITEKYVQVNENSSFSNIKDIDANNENNKLQTKYPKGVYFIIISQLFENLALYGVRAVLIIYLTEQLFMSENTAIIIYHAFTMCEYFAPIFSGMIADSWFGNFKIIIYLMFFSIIGYIAIFVGSFPTFNLTNSITMTLFGLLMINIGCGGTKACIVAFGGDQYTLPQQEKQNMQFFSLYYFTMNSASLIAKISGPTFREDIHCFGEDGCYPAAYGGFTCFEVLAFVFFVSGYTFYNIKKPKDNILLEVSSCIKHACSRKRKVKKVETRNHWLDYADDKYDIKFIEHVKIVLRIIVLYLPLAVFSTLFDQQGSRWTLQANHMNGHIFGDNYILKPDEVQVINPIIVFLLIPLLDKYIYPLCEKINILTDLLTRIFIGGLLLAIAFILSGILELTIQYKNTMEGTVEIKNVNMLWQLPQYLLLCIGEVMFVIPGLQFSYSQAPESMKSVLQACWLLKSALGNLFVIVIAGINIIDSQAYEFFFYAILLTITMFIFLYLARNYKRHQMKYSANDVQSSQL